MRLPGRLVLVGHPVAHSLSPAMQNAALKAAGISLEYQTLDVLPEKIKPTFAELAVQRAAGNVTAPHKEAARSMMSQVSLVAARVGAVNTFRTLESGELAGDNTDVAGFTALVRQTLGEIPAHASVAVIGAGGAAAAVLAAIEEWEEPSVTVYARRRESARRLAERFQVVSGVKTMSQTMHMDCDIVVNATSIGLHDETFPVPIRALPPNAKVLDLVYRPGETAWVRAARAQGRLASDGLPMLVEQGAVSFEIWFGRAPDRAVMWAAVTKSAGRN